MIPSVQKITNHANSFAAANGIQVETIKEPSSSSSSSSKSAEQSGEASSYQCAPISLLPNIFPKSSFERSKTLAPFFNELVERISSDGTFLVDTLSGVISQDEYTKKLLEMYQNVYMNDDDALGKFARKADKLGILRSDYMLNGKSGESGEYELKQVELNTIAASFACLSTKIAGLHKMLTERYGDELKGWSQENIKAVMGSDTNIIKGEVPVNTALASLPMAMNVAHEQYMERYQTIKDDNSPIILFIVQEGERNTVDQRMLEFQLYEEHQVPVVRISLTKAATLLQLDEETGKLTILPADDGSTTPTPREVSVVYFRAGYAPTDYPDGYDGIEWDSRLMIECSRATKCPSLGYHLAGTKKVQQQLARPGTLERFYDTDSVEDMAQVAAMRSAFAGLYSLGDDAVQEDIDAIKDSITGNHGQYVLKPQREGGGYNYYGENLAVKIKESAEMNGDELKLGEVLSEFILMQRLFPPQQQAILVRAGLLEGTGDSISELGCFGTIVTKNDGAIVHNQYSGFLLRTKFSNVDEGGVASGFATLSSPYLV